MLKRNTSGPEGTFVSFLEEHELFRGRLDRPALDRNLSAGRDGYHDLWEAGVLPAGDLADAIAVFHDLPRAQPDQIHYHADLFDGLSRRFLRDSWIFPFLDRGETALAVADPTRAEAIGAVLLALGEPAALRVAAFDELNMFFDQESAASGSGGARTISGAAGEEGEAGAEENLERLQDLASGAPVVHTVDAMLEAAVSQMATDIHIEPARDGVRVRIRVDGLLRQHQTLPLRMARAVVSRVKILAGLNIAERRLPQDGRARVRIGETEADLRVATMPTLHGEAVVIRILVKEARSLDLARLGMMPRDLTIFGGQLAEPHGLIVVSGPTGSGKTTTLAAALSTLNDPDRKIMTIEDPIEYQIPGIHQTQVKPSIDLTFATALRSFLRHDPDIMMVGEMRDRDTAAIAIQAALTGHLVLTTLHTNSAADAIVRLADLGVESFLLVSALRCVVGQRLVRKLCERCRAPVERLPAAAASLVDRGLFTPRPGEIFYKPLGCNWCARTGYRGRLGIFEVLPLDPEMRSLIRHNVDPVAILARAQESGMTTMMEDGLEKYRAGLTSIEDVLRATS